MCGVVFEKVKGHGGTVHRMSVYGEEAVRKALSKRCYKKFRKIQKKTSLPESLFSLVFSCEF